MRHAPTLGLALLALASCEGAGPRRVADGGAFDAASPDVDGGPIDASIPRDARARFDAGDVCGDDERGITEACDDGNADGGDGCSSDCSIEEGFRCPTVGACRPVTCGDARVESPERCDDGNADSADGCSSSCEVEAGWTCPVVGVACSAIECGDGHVAGFEQCDDGAASTPGCTSDCRLEPGFVCDVPGAACEPTECGDGTRAGTEQCDDGNVRAYDGCDPSCRNEPACALGTCTPACGDGVVLPGTSEACDDGNTSPGDGCSATCAIEAGFTCELAPLPLPASLHLPVVYRDVRGVGQDGSPIHPDFDSRRGSGITFGMVGTMLDAEGRPTFSGVVVGGSGALSVESFTDWYRDSARNLPVLGSLELARVAGGDSYAYASNEFYPLDDLGWNALGSPAPEDQRHNYGFTTEIHTWFEFHGDERLEFSGDDDLWVFVDGHLCLDVGGLHSPESAVMDLGNPATERDATQRAVVTACRARLTVGRIYELVVFHAERHCCGSNFELTLTGFQTQVSSCDWSCGDGVATRYELCDDGTADNDGGYGHCGVDCRSRGPFCGDGHPDDGFEACDEGDANDGRYDGCNADCTLGPRCGDGVRQPEEDCDAGEDNGADGGACDVECRFTLI